MRRPSVIGLDFGTNSVRALLVDAASGEELATAVDVFAHGREGVVLSDDPNLSRQHPADYLAGATTVIRAVLASAAARHRGFRAAQVAGIGVAGTGSTPLPVDRQGRALAMTRRFARHPAAMAWLWKDHTAIAEAETITALARKLRPHYLAACGGAYSSEWFFSKILHCLRTSPEVFDAAASWVEMSDWVPAMLTGTAAPGRIRVGICAAGHKAMFNADWGGYPDAAFLRRLDPKLAALRARLPAEAHDISETAGRLTDAWAARTGLTAGIPVAVGGVDGHVGGVGAGIRPGRLVKTLGTSGCDMLVVPGDRPCAAIPGIYGIVKGSILPGCHGIEAGQAAVGDLFNWFVNYIQPRGADGGHARLGAEAASLRPGASGLLALDWNNGNRNVLADPRLSGLLVGQSLYTTPAEIYRALAEATAFGALTIIRRLEAHDVKVRTVVACGGIAEKSPFILQLYADVLERTVHLSRSAQTCALGAAVAAATVAGLYRDVPAGQRAMTGLKPQVYRPDRRTRTVYRQLYALYAQLHDAFGTRGGAADLHGVMKTLLAIRARQRGDSRFL
jgi:L-ribulokinase